jgi:hypothetical protein
MFHYFFFKLLRKQMHCPRSKIKWVQSQSNEPKNSSNDCQNSIKIVILLDIFLWCHFNAMLIMECNVK